MAYDAYLDLEGVEGESTRKGFEGKIELLSYDLNVSNTTTIGSGGGAGSGKATAGPVRFSKYTDSASTAIMQACFTGKHFPKATMTLHRAGGDEAVDWLLVEMEKCFISDFSQSGSSGADDRSIDHFAVAYGKIQVTYTPQTETGAKGSPTVASWDVMAVST